MFVTPIPPEQYNQHFPSLDNTQIESYIIKSICLIYFHCCRFHHKYHAKNNSIQQTSSAHKAFLHYIHSVLEMIQSHTTHGENKHLLIYLNILFRMMFQTRDVMYGKGERDLFYMMFCCFYKHYPFLTISGIRYMLQESNIGCWSDVKYLCEYVRHIDDEFLSCAEKENIYGCLISIMLYQFDKDRLAWNDAFEKYLKGSVLMGRPKARELISFVAKWIPREGKKHDWLFERIVYQWNLIHRPFIFESFNSNSNTDVANEHYLQSMQKCKKEFRKKVSVLNRELETLQVKQCNQSWGEIDAVKVPISAMMSQKSAFVRDRGKKDRSLSAEYFKAYLYCEQSAGTKSVKTTHLDVGTFVKKAWSLCGVPLTEHICAQRVWLNNAWKQNVLVHFEESRKCHLLPIVNVSWDVDENVRNNALGMAILMAQMSTDVHRIILCASVCKCVDIDGDCDFMDVVGRLFGELSDLRPTEYNGNIVDVMLNDGLQMVDCDMYFVVLGDGYFLMKDPLTLKRNKNIHLVYWNVGRDDDQSLGEDLHGDLDRVNARGVLYLSGCTGVMVRTLVAMASRRMNTFEYLSKTLNAQRYAIYGELMNYEMGRVLYGC